MSNAFQKRMAKSSTLIAKSAALREEADYYCVVEALKYVPTVVATTKMCLFTQGYIDADGNMTAKTRMMSTKLLALEDQKATALAAALNAPALEANPTLHRNFNTWGSIPPCWFRRVFSRCKEASISATVWKGLLDRGQREPPKAICKEVLECMTDLRPEELIGNERTEDEIVGLWIALNIKNHRRLSEVVFTKDFKWGVENGVWLVLLIPPRTFSIGMKGCKSYTIMMSMESGTLEFTIDCAFSKLGAVVHWRCGTESGSANLFELYSNLACNARIQENLDNNNIASEPACKRVRKNDKLPDPKAATSAVRDPTLAVLCRELGVAEKSGRGGGSSSSNSKVAPRSKAPVAAKKGKSAEMSFRPSIPLPDKKTKQK
jgi:hypothetical protein